MAAVNFERVAPWDMLLSILVPWDRLLSILVTFAGTLSAQDGPTGSQEFLKYSATRTWKASQGLPRNHCRRCAVFMPLHLCKKFISPMLLLPQFYSRGQLLREFRRPGHNPTPQGRPEPLLDKQWHTTRGVLQQGWFARLFTSNLI